MNVGVQDDLFRNLATRDPEVHPTEAMGKPERLEKHLPRSHIMSDQARWKATVYVGGLAPMVNAANLHAAFLPFGEIADVSLP